jgi:phosphate:Na+ symporter
MTLFHYFALAGGLGLFLYGMDLMGKGLESAAGSRLKGILEKLTTNRLMGVLVGTGVTMIIQSSSATTVMLVGFVNAGLMNLMQAFGVMLGANIGTTVTAQLIAFKLSEWAPLFVILGVIPMMFLKRRKVRSIGTIIAGFGILFLGMTMMGDAMKPLRNSAWFINLMTQFNNPIPGVLIGAVFTAIIQSSSASIGIVEVLAMQGLVGLDAGIYLVLGCNIGTCATALLASIGTNTMAKRTAVMHLINKTIGAIIFTIIVATLPFGETVAKWSPGEPARQIANFHTVFNVLNTLLLLPFGVLVVKLATRIVKGDAKAEEESSLLYVDDRILNSPAIALTQMKNEVGRLADKANENVRLALDSFFDKNEALAQKVVDNEHVINRLSAELMSYLVRIQSVEEIPENDRTEIFSLHELISNIERVSDHAENISEFAFERINNGTPFSMEAIEELTRLSSFVLRALFHGTNVLKRQTVDEVEALACSLAEEKVDEMVGEMREGHIVRLQNGTCDPRAALIYSDMVVNLERLSDHACNLAGLESETFA